MGIMAPSTPSALPGRPLLLFFVVLSAADSTFAQLRYSIPEELSEGTVVGNIARDLRLDITAVNTRRFRIDSGTSESPFELDSSGVLHVKQRIDRDVICAHIKACVINIIMVLEDPLEVHNVEVKILDVNDHAPTFSEKETRLEIAESTLPGTHFQLQGARDPDSEKYSIRTYKLSQNDHFRLEVSDQGENGSIPILYLHKALDKETTSVHKLMLTAVDGGKEALSGNTEIIVNVLDVNDNMPVFSEDSYTAVLHENSPIGTTVTQVNATDLDDGSNGEVIYSFGNTVEEKIRQLFEVNKITGEITVKGLIDFEERDRYEFDIKASDQGQVPLETEKKVIVNIVDVNDNSPEIEATLLSSAIPEYAELGQTVALVTVRDRDSGANSKVVCIISEEVPFSLVLSAQDNMYSVVTRSQLDREQQSEYEVAVECMDWGKPPLSSYKTIDIAVSDVNDNSPQFLMDPYTFYVAENNAPGASLFSVSASDRDEGSNALVSYTFGRNGEAEHEITYFNINAETGQISALRIFDFETLNSFHFQVVASDSGTPSLSSQVTVHMFILDQNDNAPVILYPVSSNGTAEGVEEISRSVYAGHLVTIVKASDADSGDNGRLLFSLQEVTDHSLFGLDRYTGEIRIIRSFIETDEAEHRLVILVKDHGNVALSATATVLVKVVEPKEAFAASDVKSSTKDQEGTIETF